MKRDADHYYLSEEAHELVRDAQLQSQFGVQKGTLMERILWHLLGHQYVMSNIVSFSRAWEINYGTGMGLIHSGELTELMLYNKVESILLSIESFDEHQLTHDSRFRDDIHFVGRDTIASAPFYYMMERHSEYLKISQESISAKGAIFLTQQSRFMVRGFWFLHTRPSQLGISLSINCGHALHVHRSWPIAMVSSLKHRSSNARIVEEAKEQVMNILKNTSLLVASSSTSPQQTLGAKDSACR